MMVVLSKDRTAHTAAVCPCNTVELSHFPTGQMRASLSQLPLKMNLPSSLTSRAQTLCPCPRSRASALSSGVFPGPRTSIIESWPAETIKPCGYCFEGGTNARELTKAVP